MWRDLERRAQSLGVPYRRPAVYPLNSMSIGRVALLASREGWCREFTEAAFDLHWRDGVLMGTPENMATSLERANQDPTRVQSLASSPEIKEAFKKQTTGALERGIFGAPSFVVAGELFWGDDRLEDALNLAVCTP